MLDQMREENDVRMDQAKLVQAQRLADERNMVAMMKQSGGGQGGQRRE
jgi:hypothetical protein